MEITISSTSDENFKITTVKFGEQHVATDGERVAIGVTEEDAVKGVEEMQEIHKEIMQPKTNAAPLNNSKEGHPLDPFGGTSWAGKRNNFN